MMRCVCGEMFDSHDPEGSLPHPLAWQKKGDYRKPIRRQQNYPRPLQIALQRHR
jgi:hypothetical protein